jgi:NNP family nitrate/nitrite transporter-like MFS transporter
MIDRRFFKAGHPPRLLSALFYFDLAFMVWVILGLLCVRTQSSLHLDAGLRGYAALAMFVIAMLALGMGNGAAFQLVPQRFRREIGVMTGLVGIFAAKTRWRTTWGAVAGAGMWGAVAGAGTWGAVAGAGRI